VIQERPVRFVGGGTVPARLLGTMTGTWPLAVLEIGPAGVSLRMRKVARGFRPERLEATPATLVRVFPAHRPTTPGVGFTDGEGRTFYFWTYRGGRILDLLAKRGYAVATHE
jgi:hypothetical protein